MENFLLPDEQPALGHPMFKLVNTYRKVIFYVLGFLLAVFFCYFFIFSSPSDFSPSTIVKIEQGDNLRNVSFKLKEANIIRSRFIFEVFVILFNGEKHLMYYNYLFENKSPVWVVAKRISRGEHHMAYMSVTIPEGFDVSQIADTFSSKLTNFNKNKFLEIAKAKEGYLFPDTYFFLNTDTEKEVLKSMANNFDKKIEPLMLSIIASGKTEKEILIMASIIEGEAKGEINGQSDREFISGILWRRISIGMPLQVDVAPDTYKTRGLPSSPIGNPGLLSIKASISPEKSPYLYYLHDKDGNIYYAKSFAEHQMNIKKYLK
jgi:UPF0755 protein